MSEVLVEPMAYLAYRCAEVWGDKAELDRTLLEGIRALPNATFLHTKLHFSSSRATIWPLDDPFRYRGLPQGGFPVLGECGRLIRIGCRASLYRRGPQTRAHREHKANPLCRQFRRQQRVENEGARKPRFERRADFGQDGLQSAFSWRP